MLSPAQYLLSLTIVALGALAGLVTLRDQIVQTYGDGALALRNLNQSYNYQLFDQNGVLIDPDGNGTYTAEYNDTVGTLADLYDVENGIVIVGGSPGIVDATLNDQPNVGPGGITFPAASPEGVVLVVPAPGPNEIPPTPEGTPLP